MLMLTEAEEEGSSFQPEVRLVYLFLTVQDVSESLMPIS